MADKTEFEERKSVVTEHINNLAYGGSYVVAVFSKSPIKIEDDNEMVSMAGGEIEIFVLNATKMDIALMALAIEGIPEIKIAKQIIESSTVGSIHKVTEQTLDDVLKEKQNKEDMEE